MEPRESGAGWHHVPNPPSLRPVTAWMARQIGRLLAPQLRGRLTPRTLAELERAGWHVHHIGQAAYVHRGPDHWLFGVWPRRASAPAWATRLGRASDGYLRRVDRVTVAQAWRRMARDLAGRFTYRLAWYHWPRPAAYSFEVSRPGWLDQELAEAAVHNDRIRQARNLAGRGYRLAPPDDWYAESSPTIARAMDGDR